MTADHDGNLIYSVEDEISEIVQHARKTLKQCGRLANDLLREQIRVASFDLGRINELLKNKNQQVSAI